MAETCLTRAVGNGNAARERGRNQTAMLQATVRRRSRVHAGSVQTRAANRVGSSICHMGNMGLPPVLYGDSMPLGAKRWPCTNCCQGLLPRQRFQNPASSRQDWGRGRGSGGVRRRGKPPDSRPIGKSDLVCAGDRREYVPEARYCTFVLVKRPSPLVWLEDAH